MCEINSATITHIFLESLRRVSAIGVVIVIVAPHSLVGVTHIPGYVFGLRVGVEGHQDDALLPRHQLLVLGVYRIHYRVVGHRNRWSKLVNQAFRYICKIKSSFYIDFDTLTLDSDSEGGSFVGPVVADAAGRVGGVVGGAVEVESVHPGLRVEGHRLGEVEKIPVLCIRCVGDLSVFSQGKLVACITN